MSIKFKGVEEGTKISTSNKRLKLNNNNEYANKYAECGFIPFTLNIFTNDAGKKVLDNVPRFSNVTKENYLDYIDDDMNGMAIRMGSKTRKSFSLTLSSLNEQFKMNISNLKN